MFPFIQMRLLQRNNRITLPYSGPPTYSRVTEPNSRSSLAHLRVYGRPFRPHVGNRNSIRETLTRVIPDAAPCHETTNSARIWPFERALYSREVETLARNYAASSKGLERPMRIAKRQRIIATSGFRTRLAASN